MPDIVTSKYFVDGEKGITASKLNQIISGAQIQTDFVGTKPAASTVNPTDQLLVLNTGGAYVRAPFSVITPAVAAQIPLADNTQPGMMCQVSGNTTDVIDGTNHSVPIASMPGITQMRLRSYNAIGNPNFEVDQRCAGAATGVANGTWMLDRFAGNRTGSMNITSQQLSENVLFPGTNFVISRSYLRIKLTGTQASLAATDLLAIYHWIEGSCFRELIGDAHSVSLLVRSSVAGMKFGWGIQDSGATRSLCKLCTVPTANTWTLLQMPNIPVFPAAGTWSVMPGNGSALCRLTLAAGSSYISPANDTWQNGNYTGASGQDNWANQALNATFDVAFWQHEPGTVCTTLIDKPFQVNLDECKYYFQKSQPYGSLITAAYGSYPSGPGVAANIVLGVRFEKEMAKAPTLHTVNVSSGAIDGIYNLTTATGLSMSGSTVDPKGIAFIQVGAGLAIGQWAGFHYNVDTGF